MGVDISIFAEVREGSTWKLKDPEYKHEHEMTDFPFGWRHYGIYAFLSSGSNSRVNNMPCPTEGYRGLPEDSEYLNEPPSDWLRKYHKTRGEAELEDSNNYGFSWISLRELLDFDYEQRFTQSGILQGHCVSSTVREELGETFFEHVEMLKTLGPPDDVRIVFWFN